MVQLDDNARIDKAACYGVDFNNDAQVMDINATGAARIIDTLHSYVHSGQLYIGGHLYTAVAASASVYLILIAPASPTEVHFAFTITSSAGGRLYLIKDPSYTDGTPITPLNLNGNSINESTVSILHTPTAPTGGTTLPLSEVIPGGSGGAASGGGSGKLARGSELVAEYGATYMLQFVNDSAQPENVSITFGFYEG